MSDDSIDHGAPAGESASDRSELQAALALESEAQRSLLAGRQEQAAELFKAAADRYKASWLLASPTSFGRLVGMLKAAIIAGDAEAQATFALGEIPGEEECTVTAAYVRAMACMALGRDQEAWRAAIRMQQQEGAFERTGEAIAALAERDQAAYERLLRAIIADFEGRERHLTGVPIADTAAMLERLAAARQLAVRPRSSLLPA